MPDIEPLTAERLTAIEADLDAAWSEAGETSPVVARAVNGSYVLLSRYQRLTTELAASEKIARDNGFELARQAPTVARARGWQQRAEEAEAEVRRRGETVRALSGLHANACRKVEAVLAAADAADLAEDNFLTTTQIREAIEGVALSPTVQAEGDEPLSDHLPTRIVQRAEQIAAAVRALSGEFTAHTAAPVVAADGWPVECQQPCRRPSTGTPGTVELCDPWHGQPDTAAAAAAAAAAAVAVETEQAATDDYRECDGSGWVTLGMMAARCLPGCGRCRGGTPYAPAAAPAVAEATQAERGPCRPCGSSDGYRWEQGVGSGDYVRVPCCAAPDAVPAAAADGGVA